LDAEVWVYFFINLSSEFKYLCGYFKDDAYGLEQDLKGLLDGQEF
jgi:hypothetical protein